MTTRAMPRPGITPHIAPMTLGALINEFRQFDPGNAQREYPWANRYVMGLPLPPWQRKFKWSDDQARRFIHSAWTGVHLGTYLVTELELRREADGFRGIEFLRLSNCVIDGQQRLKALEMYLTDQLAVPDSEGTLTLWSEVDARDRRRFHNTIFSRGMIRERDEIKLAETYDLMNFGGSPHLESERAMPQISASRPSTPALEQEGLESFRASRSRSPMADVMRSHLGMSATYEEPEDADRPRC